MCDFSQYGGPSEEWLAVEKTLPAMSIDINTDPIAFKKLSNTAREEMSAQAMQALAPQVRMATYNIPTRDGSAIQARSYRSISLPEDTKLPVYLYFHGGGFMTGTLDSEDGACAALAIKIPIVVLNINYRHTPEHPFPTAWHDSQDAFAWLHKSTSLLHIDPSKVVVGGVSAGGQLTASLVLEKHLGKSAVMAGLPEIAGQILIIPTVAALSSYASGPLTKMASPEISSLKENENAPLLPRKSIDFFMHHLAAPNPAPDSDTKLNQVNATTEQVAGLPPTVFGIAGMDPLRDEGLLYAKLLAEAGVPTDVRLFKGVPHGVRKFGDRLSASREWDRAVEEGIMWVLGRPAASGRFDVKVVCE